MLFVTKMIQVKPHSAHRSEPEEEKSPMSEPVRVMCVDDNFLVAEGVAIMLRLAGGFQWVGQLSTADHLAREAADRKPHIVLLDIDLPGRDPFDALSELAAECPDVRTIMFSGYIRSDFIDRAVESGAWGYLAKGESADVVVDAIQRVLHGEFVMGPDVESLYTGRRRRS